MKTVEPLNPLEGMSPAILSLLTKDPSHLSKEEAEYLQKLNQLEKQAELLRSTAYTTLGAVGGDFTQMLKTKLDHSSLNQEQKELIQAISRQTISPALQRASTALQQPPLEELLSALLCETTIDVLDSILDFKKSFDKKLPGASEAFKIIAPHIGTIASTFCPSVGLFLTSTNLMVHLANFLDTKNLEKTVNKMRDDLAQIKKDKQLATAYEMGENLDKLSTQVKTPVLELSQLNLSAESLGIALTETSISQSAQEALQSVCRYAQNHLPESEHRIDKKLENFKQSALQTLEELGASEATRTSCEAIFNEELKQAKAEMMRSLSPGAKVFDKMESIAKAAEIMDKSAEKIASLTKQDASIATSAGMAIASTIKHEIQETIRGDMADVVKHLSRDPSTTKLAEKALGGTHAKKISIERSAKSHQAERGI